MSRELERRIDNIAQPGVICEVDHAAGLCRVSFGDRVSPPSPWMMPRCGKDVEFWAPDINEQVVYLSPSGDGSDGYVMLAVMSDQMPLPDGVGPDKHVTQYEDGTRIEIDRKEHVIEVTDSFGARCVMREDLVECVDSHGSATRMTGGNIEVNPKNQLCINAPSGVKISAGSEGSGVVTDADMTWRGQIRIIGDLDVDGNIHASGSIIDDAGNTPHHGH